MSHTRPSILLLYFCKHKNETDSRNDEDEDVLSSSMECCAICLDSILIRKEEKEMITLLSCNHVFCTKCIQEWEKYSQTCPTCREPIPSPNGVSTRTAVPAQEEQYTQQHQGGDREEQRQEGEKCFGNVAFFFFFWLHVYVVLLPLTLGNTVELDHLPYFSLLVATTFCFDKRIRNQ